MPFTYPPPLPKLEPSWNACFTGSGGEVDFDRDAWIRWELDAPDAETAEHRAVAAQAHTYEDDIRGWTATAERLSSTRWKVMIEQKGHYQR